MIPTFLGITVVSFLVINLAPGSPIDQKLQQLRFGQGSESGLGKSGSSAEGVNAALIEEMKRQYGFDKPLLERYQIWLKNIVQLNFGDSFVYQEPAIDVIASKFPVSLQFGITSLILVYVICIPLGVKRAVKAGSHFDHVSGIVLSLLYAVPNLVLGILLIVFFAGGSYFNWFPTGFLYSDDYSTLGFWAKVVDRLHHFILPLICYIIWQFAEMTTLMRNSMLDVLQQDYIRTARAMGVPEDRVLYVYALRNALLPLATGLGRILGVFLSGSLIIESVFQLDGIGLLSYKSIMARDYNVLMALIFLSAMVLMLGRFISDIAYVLVDPRIDFK